ncbi:hypothetical protein F4808DRAFT_458773 [Astrocystis sublimbata]|nr:hypothetical protein F4808DRAFT_458773 [Astrocystis sublimbata]
MAADHHIQVSASQDELQAFDENEDKQCDSHLRVIGQSPRVAESTLPVTTSLGYDSFFFDANFQVNSNDSLAFSDITLAPVIGASDMGPQAASIPTSIPDLSLPLDWNGIDYFNPPFLTSPFSNTHSLALDEDPELPSFDLDYMFGNEQSQLLRPFNSGPQTGSYLPNEELLQPFSLHYTPTRNFRADGLVPTEVSFDWQTLGILSDSESGTLSEQNHRGRSSTAFSGRIGSTAI